MPRARELTVAFGPFLSPDWLVALTDGLTAAGGLALVAAFTQRVVENLRDGVATPLDADAARAAWNGSVLGRRGARPLPRRRFSGRVP